MKHPSIADPVEFFPSHSENLASPVPDEILILPVQFVASSVRILHTQDGTCVCLKKAKQRPNRKGKPGGKFADLVRI